MRRRPELDRDSSVGHQRLLRPCQAADRRRGPWTARSFYSRISPTQTRLHRPPDPEPGRLPSSSRTTSCTARIDPQTDGRPTRGPTSRRRLPGSPSATSLAKARLPLILATPTVQLERTRPSRLAARLGGGCGSSSRDRRPGTHASDRGHPRSARDRDHGGTALPLRHVPWCRRDPEARAPTVWCERRGPVRQAIPRPVTPTTLANLARLPDEDVTVTDGRLHPPH